MKLIFQIGNMITSLMAGMFLAKYIDSLWSFIIPASICVIISVIFWIKLDMWFDETRVKYNNSDSFTNEKKCGNCSMFILGNNNFFIDEGECKDRATTYIDFPFCEFYKRDSFINIMNKIIKYKLAKIKRENKSCLKKQNYH